MIKVMKGIAHRLTPNDNISTDYIISGRYKFKIQDMKELSRYLFDDIAPGFAAKVRAGDFVVAGENFGCGSSREQAPWAIKEAGIASVIAKSFARIFYRNAFNIGLCLVECDTSRIADGDELELDIERGVLRDAAKKIDIRIKPIAPLMRRLLEDGGVIAHFNRYGGFKIET